jgi:hypothetical protein
MLIQDKIIPLLRSIMLRNKASQQITLTPDHTGRRQFLTWGLAVSFATIGLALLALPYQFDKVRVFFVLAAIFLIISFALSASGQFYPRLLIALFGAVAAGLAGGPFKPSFGLSGAVLETRATDGTSPLTSLHRNPERIAAQHTPHSFVRS